MAQPTKRSVRTQPTNARNKPERSSNVKKQYGRSRERVVRLTPWKDAWELETVASSLASAQDLLVLVTECNRNTTSTTRTSDQVNDSSIQIKIEHVKDALKSVAVWRHRGGERACIPHAMETMAALVQVILRDIAACSQRAQHLLLSYNTTTNCPVVSSTELRLAYAAAVVRGINGLADALQQQQGEASSVAALCASLGIPIWLVDVRHESTHNELTPLSVLRLAAGCLLGYLEERYVQAVVQLRNQARAAAFQLLHEYDQVDPQGVNHPNKLVETHNCPDEYETTISYPELQVFDDDNQSRQSSVDSINETYDDDDDDENDEENIVVEDCASWGRKLGTFSNRFAALQDDKPRQSTISPVGPRIEKSEKQKKRCEPDYEPTQEGIAIRFCAITPLDIGFNVALSFLVWGYKTPTTATCDDNDKVGDNLGNNDVESNEHPGVLLSPIESFESPNQSFQQIQKNYQPLIVALGQAWPGFWHALLVHLVDFLLATETASEDNLSDDTEHLLLLASCWIRFLLSEEAVSQLDVSNTLATQSSKGSKRQKIEIVGENPPQLSMLLEMLELPLKAICNRLNQHLVSKKSTEQCPATNKRKATSRELHQYLLDFLHDHSAVKMSSAIATQPCAPLVSEPNLDSNLTAAATMCDDSLNSKGMLANGRLLSLTEMEAILLEGTSHPGCNSQSMEKVELLHQSVPTKLVPYENLQKRKAWVKCTSWEPCAIGSLPGFPI